MQYSTSWATNRVDEAVDAFGRTYRGVTIASDEDDRFRVSTVESGDDEVALVSYDWVASGRGRTSANSFYIVGDIVAGSVALSAARESLDTTRVMLMQPLPLETAWDDSHSARTVRVQRAAVDAYAREHFGASTPTVTFSRSSPASPAHELLWRAAERHARDAVSAHPDLLHNDLIWKSTSRHLTATLLAVFPNSTLDIAAARDGVHALPASVRRAVGYMEEHLAEPISVADIAAAARLSPRGLQDAFKRLLGLSPMQQLRLLRLEAARNELVASDPADGTTVGGVARRWGFVHVPRFAQNYRAQFGENPSLTLHR